MSADSDKTLKIQIDLEKTGKGGEEAKLQLDALNKEMGVINVSADEAAKALKKTGDSTGEAGEKAELSHMAHRRLAHALGSEIPGGAALMEAAMESTENKVMSSVFLVVAGMELLKGAMEKLNKEQEQSRKLAEDLVDADSKVSDVIDKEREALDRAQVAQDVFYHDFLRNTRSAVDAAEKLHEAMRKATGAEALSVDEKRKNISEKAVEDMEQRGVLSHAQAVQLKEQIDLDYERRKLERQMAEDQAEEASLITQLNNKKLQAGYDARAETEAEQKFAAADAAKARNDAQMEAAKEKAGDAKSVLKGLRDAGVTDENIQKLNDFVAQYGGDENASLADKFHFAAMKNLGVGRGSLAAHDIVNLFGSQGDANLALYEGAQLDIKGANNDLKRSRNRAPDIDLAEATSKSDVDYARQRMEKDKDAIGETQDKLDTAHATNQIKEHGARVDFGLDAAAAALAGHANNINTFMGQVNRLAAAMANMTPADAQALERRIAAIEAQLGGQRYIQGGG